MPAFRSFLVLLFAIAACSRWVGDSQGLQPNDTSERIHTDEERKQAFLDRMVLAQVNQRISAPIPDGSILDVYGNKLATKIPGIDKLGEQIPQMLATPLIPKCIFIFATCLVLSAVYWIISMNFWRKSAPLPRATKLCVTVVINHVDYAIGTVRLENESTSKKRSKKERAELSLKYNAVWSKNAISGSDEGGNHLRIEVLTEEERVVKTGNVPIPLLRKATSPEYYIMRWKGEDRVESLTFRVKFMEHTEKAAPGVILPPEFKTKTMAFTQTCPKGTAVLTVVDSSIKKTKAEQGEDGFHLESYTPAVAFFFLYIFIGTIFFVKWESWDAVPAVYFCISTMFTVGYGELAPSDRISKLFTAILAIIGVSFLGVTLCTTQIDVTLATVKYQKPRDNDRKKMMIGMMTWFVVELLNLVFAMILLQQIEKFDALDAAYFLVMTSTTEGFGDVAVRTSLGRLAVILYISVECLALGQLMRIFFTWYVTKRMKEVFPTPLKNLETSHLDSPRADHTFSTTPEFQDPMICD